MKLLDQVRTQMRVRHYAYATEKSYCHWIRRFILFNKKKHPSSLGAEAVANFLSYLAVNQKVAASTQNQALCGILFLYRHVLGIDLGDIGSFSFSKVPRRLPTVLSKQEVASLLSSISGVYKTIAALLYGAGLRQNEVLRLRIADISFDRNELIIRNAKGNKDRITMLPKSCIEDLKLSVEKSRQYFDEDMNNGIDYVWLRYPNSAGITRSFKCSNDNDIYSCVKPWKSRRYQPC